MPKQKHTQPRPKTLYRVKNWSAYDQALVERGSITLWISEDFAKTWLYAGEKQRGSQFDYSDPALQIMLTIKEVFHRTNRGTEGFVRSIFKLMKVDLPVPDHTTLSRRGKDLKVKLPKKANGGCGCTVLPNGVPGANCMWEPTRKMAKSRRCS
jgi:hypothetical protein